MLMLAGHSPPNLFCLLIQAQSVYGIITRSSLCFYTNYRVSISRFSHKSARTAAWAWRKQHQDHTPHKQQLQLAIVEDKESSEWLTRRLTIINNLARRWPKYFLRDAAWSIGENEAQPCELFSKSENRLVLHYLPIDLEVLLQKWKRGPIARL